MRKEKGVEVEAALQGGAFGTSVRGTSTRLAHSLSRQTGSVPLTEAKSACLVGRVVGLVGPFCLKAREARGLRFGCSWALGPEMVSLRLVVCGRVWVLQRPWLLVPSPVPLQDTR